ncbi:hypothetical protein GYMLUDRAFT_159018 [Collybiopsis luxurians FD-317 M1]|nr:hypothetical protein GYMLUDRAFT_159018 [Collybiopsis luxurians FD-317 M1]
MPSNHLKSACSILASRSRDIHLTSRNLSSHSGPSLRAKQLSRRGGQNLTERYVRLEKTLRGKEALEAEYGDLRRSASGSIGTTSLSVTLEKATNTFKGLVIPQRPKEPQSDECCMSGCAVCVYDLYDESLVAYRDAVAKVKATLAGMGVPESEWPKALRSDNAGGVARKNDITLSVFEQMELNIQRRKQERLALESVANVSAPQTSNGAGIEVGMGAS